MAKTNVRGGRPQWELRRLLRRLASCRKLQPFQAYAVVHLIQSPRTRGIGNRHHFDVPSGTNGLRRLSRAESENLNQTRNRSPNHNEKSFSTNNRHLSTNSLHLFCYRIEQYVSRSTPNKTTLSCRNQSMSPEINCSRIC